MGSSEWMISNFCSPVLVMAEIKFSKFKSPPIVMTPIVMMLFACHEFIFTTYGEVWLDCQLSA